MNICRTVLNPQRSTFEKGKSFERGRRKATDLRRNRYGGRTAEELR